MIGVALRLCDTLVISEFFELFKTPWEFFKPNRTYEIIITDEMQFNYFEAKLVIVFHRDLTSVLDRNENKLDHQPVLLRCGEIIFPIYRGVKKVGEGLSLIYSVKTGESVGSYHCRNGKVILHIGYDFFKEIGYLITIGQPSKYACFPTLDTHINNLRKWILEAGVPLIEIPPVANNSKFFACLTHDVDFAGIKNHKFDHTLAGFVYRALIKSVSQFFKGQISLKMLARNWIAVAELPFIYLGLLKDFWVTFKQYRDIEIEARSTFFFVPFKGKPGRFNDGNAPSVRAVKYDVTYLKSYISQLIVEGCEIGVHGIDSWIDVESGEKEIDKIRELTGQSMLGVRMHWLYFDIESPIKLEKAGYVFDSTWGYNEKIGYKAGTSQVYRPLGAKQLLELPMHIMDTALFYPDRMNMTFLESIKAIKILIKTAASNGGVLTLNWHDRSIAPERLWDKVYCCVLKELKMQGAYFLTAGGVVNWFRKRRAILFDQISSKRLSIKIKLTGLNISPADGMVLRIYSPSKQSFFYPQLTTTNDILIYEYQDILLGEQKEVEVFHKTP